MRGCPPQTPPVGQGRTPGTRHGRGDGLKIFIILHSVALQSLENVVDERLLGGDGCLEIGNLVF